MNKSKLIGIWGDKDIDVTIEILDDKKFKFNKKSKTYSGTWTIDNSNKLLTLKGENNFLEFATLNNKRDAIFIKNQSNSKTSLFKRN